MLKSTNNPTTISERITLLLNNLSLENLQLLEQFVQFLYQQEQLKSHPELTNKPLPQIFYKPTKIQTYQILNRDEIYDR